MWKVDGGGEGGNLRKVGTIYWNKFSSTQEQEYSKNADDSRCMRLNSNYGR